MAPLGIAIIGSGIFAREEHLPAVLASPLLSIKAIWSRSLKSAQAVSDLIPSDYAANSPVDLYSADSGEGKAYDDLLKRTDIVGVILALPIMDQPRYTEKALSAGKHVLAEKPIAADVASALKLIEFHRKLSNKTIFAIAENFRFKPGFLYGAEQVKKLGKVTNFVVRTHFLMEQSNKYYNTAWRTKPEYQGGFLLDAGVHFTAAIRFLLGDDAAVESLRAQTSLIRSYLAPVDSVNAILKTKSGAVGTYSTSVGTTLFNFTFDVACENGGIQADSDKVVTTLGSGAAATREEKKWERTSGVKEEVHAWAESIASGTPNPLQTPEQALGDLELLEKMLTSGDHDGALQKLEYQ